VEPLEWRNAGVIPVPALRRFLSKGVSMQPFQAQPRKTRDFVTRRSESEMVSMAPLTLRLGTKDYSVPILNNRKAAAWRTELHAAMAPIIAGFDFSGIDLNANHNVVQTAMNDRLKQEMLAFPQKLADLMFLYAPSLPAEEILDEATDEQIGLAFSQIAEVGYPFFFHLWATKRALAVPMEKPPQMPTPSTLQ
jgi:hypothetical protein